MVAIFGWCDKIFIHRIILPYHFLLENIINFKDIYVMKIILVEGKDGTATITYPDGSKDTIKGSDLVVGKSNGNTSSIQSGSKKSKNLPKAGIESEAMMMAAAALSTLGGLYDSKKKKEDEE